MLLAFFLQDLDRFPFFSNPLLLFYLKLQLIFFSFETWYPYYTDSVVLEYIGLELTDINLPEYWD